MAPREPPRLAIAERLRGPEWALVPIASIVLVVFGIRFLSDTATGVTYLAVVAVPPLAAAALGWAARGARPIAAIGAAALFAVAWAAHKTLVGEAAAALLGAVLASDRRRQWGAAVVTLAIAALFDLLFLVINELPATVPVALALIVIEAWPRVRASAVRSRSTPAGAIPRPAK